MNWSDLSQTIGKAAPIIGTLLGGQGGAAIGSLISSALGVGSSADDVEKALAANPDLLLKIKELESNEKIKLQELVHDQAKAEIAAASQNMIDVNKTMQEETKSEHFLSYSWRPLIGYAVAFNIASSSIITMVAYGASMAGHGEVIASLPSILGALAAINTSALPILGIASWFRGKAQADPNITTTIKG